MNRDQLVTLAAALSPLILALCVAHGWLSKQDAEFVAAIVAACVAAYHVPNAKAAAALRDAAPNVVSSPAGSGL